jgi:serine/threonine protein kinase
VIKVLDEKNRDNKEEVAQLKQEFEVTRQLDHPNVIKIFEMNITTPAFLVMEVFSMMNLKQALRQDRERLMMDYGHIVEQCAAALNHLHEKGWVHSDVKPDNFLLNDDNHVKLIDLSIAKKSASGFFARMFGGQKVIRGTRSYMSPEQIRGKPMDCRADIYSFGCMIFELLAGKPPYTANSPNELLTKHLSAPIPTVQVHNDNVTPEMNDLLRKLMAKEPEKRPKTMSEVLGALKAVRIFRSPPKRSSAPGDQAKTKS